MPPAEPERTLESAKQGGAMPDYKQVVEAALDAERASIVAERLKIAEERLKLADRMREADERQKPSWWAEWTKPGPLLAIAALFGGQFIAYQTDKATMNTTITDVRNVALSRAQEQGAALLSLTSKIDSSTKAADDRSAKYVPIIEGLRASSEAQKLINDQTGDRIASIARSIQDLRASVDALRDAVQKTHEELMVDKARREGRLIGRGKNAPLDEPLAEGGRP